MTTYKTVTYGSIEVCYLDEIDGGGMRFGQNYTSFLPRHIGKVDHAAELCAGPGFIGFSLLAAGLCEKLTLIDINPVATEACRETVRRNKLSDRVEIYQSDCLDDVPPSVPYDLVVANPPHCSDTTPSPGGHTALIYNDLGWRMRRKFYRQISDYLAGNGRVILQEDAGLSTADDFRPMIEEAGLSFLASIPCSWDRDQYRYYYVESRLSEKHAEHRRERAAGRPQRG